MTPTVLQLLLSGIALALLGGLVSVLLAWEDRSIAHQIAARSS